MPRIDLNATASPAVRRLNPDIFGEAAQIAHRSTQSACTPADPADAGVAAKMRAAAKSGTSTGISAGNGRTRQRRMNKTEARAMEWLRWQGYDGIIAQPTRLFPLAGGGTYTPDFLAWSPGGGCVWVIEVKGGYRGPGWDQGYERYRRTALQYAGIGSPWRFALLTWSARRHDWAWDAWC